MSRPPRAFRLNDPDVTLTQAGAPEPPPGPGVSIRETEAVFAEAVVEEAIEAREAERSLGRRCSAGVRWRCPRPAALSFSAPGWRSVALCRT